MIGLTGGIGSGKTTVCQIFQSIGIPVYYADPRAKWLMSFHRPLKNALKQALGSDIYHRNGRLNRKAMADIIFHDKDKLEQVNKLVHPAVHQDAAEWVKKQTAPYIIYEAALLIENGSYTSFDFLIVVTAPKEIRINRVMKRDNIDRKQVLARINNQIPQGIKNLKADFLITNDGYHSLIQQVVEIHQQLLNRQ